MLLAPELQRRLYLAVPLVALLLCAWVPASAQSLYKYRDDNGNWVYTDRAPAGGEPVEVRSLKPGAVARDGDSDSSARRQ